MQSYKKNITPRNKVQEEYLTALKEMPIVIAIGAPGGGKTYLSVYRACRDLDKNRFDKLILIRPVVATESLGFLPGDLHDKLDPYLRPLFDVLHERWGVNKVNKKIEIGEIELAALAFLRGRTFHNSFIILDEAQNTTVDQMRMFITRLGEYSKCVITGDPLQSDIPGQNGLTWISEKLEKCKIVKIVHFKNSDIVRSEIMKEIVKYIE